MSYLCRVFVYEKSILKHQIWRISHSTLHDLNIVLLLWGGGAATAVAIYWTYEPVPILYYNLNYNKTVVCSS